MLPGPPGSHPDSSFLLTSCPHRQAHPFHAPVLVITPSPLRHCPAPPAPPPTLTWTRAAAFPGKGLLAGAPRAKQKPHPVRCLPARNTSPQDKVQIFEEARSFCVIFHSPAQVSSAEVCFSRAEEGLSCLTPGLRPEGSSLHTASGAARLPWGPSTEPDAKEVLPGPPGAPAQSTEVLPSAC